MAKPGEKPFIGYCVRCGRKFYTDNRRYKLCPSCRNENLPKNAGRKHYARYRVNRIEALKRDDYHCQCCGDTKKLSVHHLDLNFRNNNIGNLITLCNQCHSSLHGNYSDKELKENNIYDLFPVEIKWGIFGKRLIYNKEDNVYINKKIPTKRPKFFKH